MSDEQNKNGGSSEMPGGSSASSDRGTAQFLEAQRKHRAAAQKYKADIESSSEEELESNNVLDTVLNTYSLHGGKTDNLGRTKKFLDEAFQSGSVVCVICIATVKRTDEIWTCVECFCYFHLICIMKWGAESVCNLKRMAESVVRGAKKPTVDWSCPNCRHSYVEEDIPRRNYCFCLKVEDPPFHPWQIPHSCGNTCGRELKPLCGHKCLLLCHPGPCPPCPKMVKNGCYCQKQPPQIKRCSNKFWSCGQPCGKVLKCGKHKCSKVCHDGDCPSCPETSIQYCLCGSQEAVRLCATPQWQCDKICGKTLNCKNHTCEKLCHDGECEACPSEKSRTCPCGKTLHKLPCTEEVPLCGDTCGRLLECGIHTCSRSCHHDKCGTCLEVISKNCRCGAHTKEHPCRKEFICETKCKRVKSCMQHTCSRKCCDGCCPPCEKICGRPLACGSHKCTSVCHQGPCYPCIQTVTLVCFCKATSLTIPCGARRKSKPPKCSQACKKPSECHHDNAGTHKCHYGKCPPCQQMCGLPLESCTHLCQAQCHHAPDQPVSAKNTSTWPWDTQNVATEAVIKGCPPCQVPVPVTCLGEHETIEMPCSSARQMSCGRSCGRSLACGNHLCDQICHVPGGTLVNNNAGSNCNDCESGCLKPRPEGCTHSCLRPCHPGTCRPCCEVVRLRCHCQLNLLHINCSKWTAAKEDEKISLLNCGNRCSKTYKCGHRCKEICHSGDCPNETLCQKKVKIQCECRRLKKDVGCDVFRGGVTKIRCDKECERKKKEQHEAEVQKLSQKEQEEKRKQEEEMDLFQKKFQGRKKHRSKQNIEKEEPPSFFQQYYIYLCSAVILVIAVLILLNTVPSQMF